MEVRVEERGLFEGFLMGRNKTRVSIYNLLMTLSFFFRASLGELQSLKLILLVFGYLSGLRINLNKSTLSVINISQYQIPRMASLLVCTVLDWPLAYLSLPLGGNPKWISFWDLVIDRVFRRLDEWKKAFLSLGGRITLI